VEGRRVAGDSIRLWIEVEVVLKLTLDEDLIHVEIMGKIADEV
jgi:hypothetical protein